MFLSLFYARLGLSKEYIFFRPIHADNFNFIFSLMVMNQLNCFENSNFLSFKFRPNSAKSTKRKPGGICVDAVDVVDKFRCSGRARREANREPTWIRDPTIRTFQLP